jgi:hypothetical protein
MVSALLESGLPAEAIERAAAEGLLSFADSSEPQSIRYGREFVGQQAKKGSGLNSGSPPKTRSSSSSSRSSTPLDLRWG